MQKRQYPSLPNPPPSSREARETRTRLPFIDYYAPLSHEHAIIAVTQSVPASHPLPHKHAQIPEPILHGF